MSLEEVLTLLSGSPSDSIRISPSSLPSAHAVLRSRSHFKLAGFSVRTLMRTGQHACFLRTVVTLGIDVPCSRDSLSRFQFCRSIGLPIQLFGEDPSASFCEP